MVGDKVGPRRAEACLGGQDDGALGSTRSRKRIDPAVKTWMDGNVVIEHVRCFYGKENEFGSKRVKDLGGTALSDHM